jgi:radical SAM-linked protein
VTVTRVRIRFAKVGKVRWTSHRDIARMWERAFRRIGFPVAYTAGFSPRPRVSFGLALPTGHESVAEYLDVDVSPGAAVDVDHLPATLSEALPGGVDALVAAAVPAGCPSLQEEVYASTWRWSVMAPGVGAPVLEGRLDDLLSRTEVTVTRRRKGGEVTEDIRPAILSLRATEAADGIMGLEGELAARPRSLRPSDVVAALDGGWMEGDVRRLNQWIWRDGARCEPLGWPTDATNAARPLERAS